VETLLLLEILGLVIFIVGFALGLVSGHVWK
jgi:hypothetical protein